MMFMHDSIAGNRASRSAAALVAVATLAAAALASSGAAGAARTTPKAGPVAIQSTFVGGAAGKVVVAGAIGDWGTGRSIDENGKPDDNGNYLKLTLRKGTFEIDATALNRKSAAPRPQVASDATCSVSVTVSAPVTFLNGTGLYAGISGKATMTLTFSGIGGRYTSGARKGQCEHSQNGRPLFMLGSAIGRGTVHFG